MKTTFGGRLDIRRSALLGAAGDPELVPLVGEEPPERRRDRLFVVNYQDVSHRVQAGEVGGSFDDRQ